MCDNGNTIVRFAENDRFQKLRSIRPRPAWSGCLKDSFRKEAGPMANFMREIVRKNTAAARSLEHAMRDWFLYESVPKFLSVLILCHLKYLLVFTFVLTTWS